MAIVSFAFEPDLSEKFIRFGYAIYRGDDTWVPPFRAELRRQLSPDHPFFQTEGNCHQHFLASAGREVVGRVSAMVNSDLRDGDGTPVGTVGFFECIDDYAVASDLLGKAAAWMWKQHGIRRIWGPMNFDIWHGYRFLTQGFDQTPVYGEPYNKPYYPVFFERAGFRCRETWESIEVDSLGHLEHMMAAGEACREDLLQRGYRLEHINLRDFRNELRKLHFLITESFSGFLGFTRIEPQEFERLYSGIRYALNPRLVFFAYDEAGLPAGFLIAFPDISTALRAMKGRAGLVGRLAFLWRRKQAKRITLYAGGLTPAEISKRSGLARATFSAFLQNALEEGGEQLTFALMAKEGKARRWFSDEAPANRREYALYEWNP